LGIQQILKIYQFIKGLEPAYSLGKMVEKAPIKGRKISLHRYSTASCGFEGRKP